MALPSNSGSNHVCSPCDGHRYRNLTLSHYLLPPLVSQHAAFLFASVKSYRFIAINVRILHRIQVVHLTGRDPTIIPLACLFPKLVINTTIPVSSLCVHSCWTISAVLFQLVLTYTSIVQLNVTSFTPLAHPFGSPSTGPYHTCLTPHIFSRVPVWLWIMMPTMPFSIISSRE